MECRKPIRSLEILNWSEIFSKRLRQKSTINPTNTPRVFQRVWWPRGAIVKFKNKNQKKKKKRKLKEKQKQKRK